jgi:hypothetical protein
MYAQQRRQFIPQGAIKFVEIAIVFFRSAAVMTRVFNFPFQHNISYSIDLSFCYPKTIFLSFQQKDTKS